jgi:hypothetical protein
MQLADLLMWLSFLVMLPGFVYFEKNRHRKGEPDGREQKRFLWITVFLSAGFLVAGFVVLLANS